MAIKKYVATKDTTITDAFKLDLTSRATDANMGESDTLEVFSIYAQGIPPLDEDGNYERDGNGNIINSVEKARVLIQFPIAKIKAARTANEIPVKGNVEFKLKLYNAVHGYTLPRQFTVKAFPLTTAWSEGIGLDMEEYSDNGATASGKGADWKSASSGVSWTSEGGDFNNHVDYTKSATFDDGTEDLDVDITNIVEDWLDETIDDYGLLLMLTQEQEDCDSRESYYTKKFFARGSEYFFKRPSIEALWDSSKKDDRGNFYAKSNLRDTADNTNVIYLKNIVDGAPKNIEGVSQGGNALTVKFYEDEDRTEEVVPDTLAVTNSTVGSYMASVVLDTDKTKVYADWQDVAGVVYHSEIIKIMIRGVASETLPVYVTNITNMKSVYSSDETARFKLYCRLKDWNPTIYTMASRDVESSIVEKAYFRLVRVVDEEVVIDYGEHTMLSYDESGNYFDLDMELLEPSFAYRIELQYDVEGNPQQQPETFKFRVE